MKLEKRGTGRRLGRAAEVIYPPEDMPDRIFDPRLDLGPGVYEELRKTVKRESSFKGPKIFKIPRLSWMSWFDPSYRDDLGGIEHYKERQCKELQRLALLFKEHPHNLKEVNQAVAFLLQEFPEVRPELDDFTSKRELARTMQATAGVAENYFLKDYLVIWLQIWPQHKDEIMKLFLPKGIDKYLQYTDVHGFARPTECIHFVAQVMLAFPEYREHLLKLVDPLVKKIRPILTTLSQGISRDDFNEYHQLIGDLTIIGAKQTIIDQQGLIQVELQPLHQSTKVTPLPDRSTL